MKTNSLNRVANALEAIGIHLPAVHYNLSPAELVQRTLLAGQGMLTETGALMCDTGRFTGRAPKDRYIVKDAITTKEVWWGDVNLPFDPEKFDALQQKMGEHLAESELYVRDVLVGADPAFFYKIRIVNTLPWQNLFCHNMFIEPDADTLAHFTPDYTILAVPQFQANPATDGTKSPNFSIINFSKKMILIGGSAYTGEIKKGVFSVLNLILPLERKVLPMHCSANKGKKKGDTAIFFGLSGTGKTTLSADPNRMLIGDDEHGWADKGIFNFEGGCYAKVIGLSREKEPQIWDAIRFGALLENTRFFPKTRTVNYQDATVTENTRVSYSLDLIENAAVPSVGDTPKNIFFLTCDAYGVLPPISKLNKSQAMYHFIAGYTAKVAGTEEGITEPKTAFSACFGAPFMPLHPTVYATMLGERMDKQKVNVWLVNTGWTGGPYGIGSRIRLEYTRAMITAALNGELDHKNYRSHSVFGMLIPDACPGVPAEILSPRQSWNNDEAYYAQAMKLAAAFHQNFEKFRSFATEDILAGGPKPVEVQIA